VQNVAACLLFVLVFHVLLYYEFASLTPIFSFPLLRN